MYYPAFYRESLPTPALDHIALEAIQPSPFADEKAEVHKDHINVPQINNIRRITGLANKKCQVVIVAG